MCPHLSVCLTSRWSAVQVPAFRNLVYELTVGQAGTGYAWKLYICLKPVAQLYICCAAATLVSGTGIRVAPWNGDRRKSFFYTCVLSICVLVCVCVCVWYQWKP